jgi:hypothetical protein
MNGRQYDHERPVPQARSSIRPDLEYSDWAGTGVYMRVPLLYDRRIKRPRDRCAALRRQPRRRLRLPAPA